MWCPIGGQVWSMSDWSCLLTLEGHGASVLRLRFASRGERLVYSA